MLSLPEYTRALRNRFAADGYLPLPALVPPETLPVLDSEVKRLGKLAVRRDFAMECMDRSPRHMTTLGGHAIARESELIPQLYRDEHLLDLLGRIADLQAVPVSDPLERHVINSLHEQGDTHGAHTDDYPLALVLFTEAPADPADGGLLEYAPRAGDLNALRSDAARRAHHRPGDGYLLRSDTTAHRVTPLRRAGLRRTVLNFAYTTPDRQQAVTRSASQLY
ncbi:HalD/BesD family halogenase [Streptomyces longisporoflavus]|uniref:Fe2OG dioxygenase domain-containing protein n=1 Tax=Streptomyces longisporoflavus TaxID=28044 RepID=A0ABW7QRL0_9ACTN